MSYAHYTYIYKHLYLYIYNVYITYLSNYISIVKISPPRFLTCHSTCLLVHLFPRGSHLSVGATWESPPNMLGKPCENHGKSAEKMTVLWVLYRKNMNTTENIYHPQRFPHINPPRLGQIGTPNRWKKLQMKLLKKTGFNLRFIVMKQLQLPQPVIQTSRKNHGRKIWENHPTDFRGVGWPCHLWFPVTSSVTSGDLGSIMFYPYESVDMS